jgi:hypothetical protein
MQSLPCPDVIIQNELGIKNTMSCAVNHVKTVKEKKEKVFDNKKDAVIFYNNAKLMIQISNVKIDSIK